MHVNLFTNANWPQGCAKYRNIHYAFANCADGLQIPKQSEVHKRSQSKTMKAAMKHARTREHMRGRRRVDVKKQNRQHETNLPQKCLRSARGILDESLWIKSARTFYLSSMLNKDYDITFLAGDTQDLIKIRQRRRNNTEWKWNFTGEKRGLKASYRGSSSAPGALQCEEDYTVLCTHANFHFILPKVNTDFQVFI